MENKTGITILRDLLDEDTRKFTTGEIHLQYNLEVWMREADSLQLKAVLHKYLDYIREHVNKLQAFFVQENINYISFDNPLMNAFINEANEKLAACTDVVIKDVCLLACIQGINHYKMSVYGTASSFAKAISCGSVCAISEAGMLNIQKKIKTKGFFI